MRVQRTQAHGEKRNTRVVVPMTTFPVHDIFALPPATPALDWGPTIVQYRAVAAGYHEGTRADNGHYWAFVRGTEPTRGAVPTHLGYRKCDDAKSISAGDLARGWHWEDPIASRFVAIVALERVDTSLIRKSLSEKLNVLSRMPPVAAGLICPACHRSNPLQTRACLACSTPLKNKRQAGA